MCDPVQENPYEVGGCSMSDFVLPGWFDEESTIGRKVDLLDVLKGPFLLAPAGCTWVVRHADGTTEQIFGARRPPDWWLATRRRARRGLGL